MDCFLSNSSESVVGRVSLERDDVDKCSRPEDPPEREEARSADSPPILSYRDPRVEIRTVT